MKKQLLLISSVLLSASAFSQITINAADGPQLNQVTIIHYDTLNTTGPGANGPSITWNFGSLLNHTADTILFGPVAGTPAASTFTTSTLCIANAADSAYSYLTNNSSGLTVDGYQFQNAGVPTIMKFNPPQKLMNYPSTYNSSFTNTSNASLKMAFNSPPFDSIWLKQSVYQTSNINAWGTLTTPSGVYNALRQDWKDVTTDSIFGHAFGSWSSLQTTVDSARGARWWANGVGFTIMEEELDADSGYVMSTTYMHITSSVGIKESAPTAFILCYPNPATDELNFMTKNNAGDEIIVSDMQGKLVQKIVIDEATEKINTSAWAEGIYHYTLFAKDNTTLSGKIVVTH